MATTTSSFLRDVAKNIGHAVPGEARDWWYQWGADIERLGAEQAEKLAEAMLCSCPKAQRTVIDTLDDAQFTAFMLTTVDQLRGIVQRRKMLFHALEDLTSALLGVVGRAILGALKAGVP